MRPDGRVAVVAGQASGIAEHWRTGVGAEPKTCDIPAPKAPEA
ncbi:hypothetical protein SAMN04489712_101680 [Thermomonospora echinospora]|uniref:Uncharacterized protein n=1 Tax=Thermomonospora echinospora TaxID=1992 RepID=A0A1H5TPR3_9ACTN|nr:hypothetical protein [Thermomonospora echinospora]SEF64007.1 hypothetical protein SAMN04489712_101680 [Thermomonospora echinospora]